MAQQRGMKRATKVLKRQQKKGKLQKAANLHQMELGHEEAHDPEHDHKHDHDHEHAEEKAKTKAK